jgi:hypothetical protein
VELVPLDLFAVERGGSYGKAGVGSAGAPGPGPRRPSGYRFSYFSTELSFNASRPGSPDAGGGLRRKSHSHVWRVSEWYTSSRQRRDPPICVSHPSSHQVSSNIQCVRLMTHAIQPTQRDIPNSKIGCAANGRPIRKQASRRDPNKDLNPPTLFKGSSKKKRFVRPIAQAGVA